MRCKIENCQNPVKNKKHQLCNAHYLRLCRHGDPLAGGPMLPAGRTLLERLMAKIVKGPTTEGCWMWQGARDGTGYGQINVDGVKRRPAHLVLYELLVGSIPAGLDLDHTCHNADQSCRGGSGCKHRLCCNPSHLEPVTRTENARRGVKGRPDVRTTCSKGHLLAGENLYVEPKTGYRKCQICRRAKMQKFIERRRLAKAQ